MRLKWCRESQRTTYDDVAQRLVDTESSFVTVMSHGAARFSRPLRHCACVTPQHRALLFQNIEKVSQSSLRNMATVSVAEVPEPAGFIVRPK